MHLTQADIRRTIRAAFIARSTLNRHADALVRLLTRAGIVDDHGHLHAPAGSPIGGQFIAKPLSFVSAAARRRLADIVRQSGGRRSRLAGGGVAETSEVNFPDGSVVVHKRYLQHPEKAKVEYAVSLVGEAVGARVPPVVRDSDDSVWMGRVDGEPGFKLTEGHNPPKGVLESDAGLRLGLLDILTANGDRHGDNWLMAEDGPIGIDHGEAFKNDRVPPGLDFTGFARNFVYKDSFGNTAWRSTHPLTRQDLAQVRTRLERLEGEFDALGLSDHYRAMMRRLDEVTKRAGGKP